MRTLTIRATKANCPTYKAFKQHARNAKQQGKGFELSIGEWFWLWLNSGHFDRRGCKHPDDYVMARNGPDIGPYRVGNVTIKTVAENAAEKLLAKQSRDQMSASRVGKPSRNGQPCIAAGVRYEKMKDALAALGICQAALRRRLDAKVDGYQRL